MLTGKRGQVLVVVDQPATIGALAVAVAQDMGITVRRHCSRQHVCQNEVVVEDRVGMTSPG
ncbi:hypothetical protein EII10_12670 [Actinomyces bowdenii]|uniref:Uncharacterized protein n=1 Tax=Actinomyces bowdenii TaxID=131109 RepID=A0A3P1UKG9_9ACTO|nr:hypothetical protein EII10_12670 [Actinomyces bowdenii]